MAEGYGAESPDATAVVEAFGKLLAAEPDPDKRKRLKVQANMIGMAEAAPEAFEPPIRTLGDYLAAEIEVPPVLIHPYMCVRGGLNVTVGRAGKGKTVMNLNRILRWSAGLPMFDTWTDKEGNHIMAPDMPLRILIVENEGAAGLFHRQVGIMLNAEGYLTPEARALAKENTLIWKDGGYSNLKLDEESKLAELRAGVEKWKPDLVFIEPFRSLWSGEENSSTEMNVVTDALVNLATDFQCGVWAAHHEKKGGHGEDDKMSAARGSSVLEGVVTVMENFESIKSDAYREITYSKSRHGKAPLPVSMEWDSEAWWYKHVPSEQITDDILDALRNNGDEPMSVNELVEHTDYTKTKISAALKDMKKDGKVKSSASVQLGEGRGTSGVRYRIPSNEAASSNSFGGLDVV